MPTIFAVGRNYAVHAREMGSPVAPGSAGNLVVFLKPEHALLAPPGPIHPPAGAGEIHHEAELVVRVGPDGPSPDAVALGLDLTDRTRQAKAKAAGLPWAAAKGFRGAACVGPWVPVEEVPPLDALVFTLEVNGRLRQRGETASLLRPVHQLLEEIEAWFGLSPGDLVYTGTPQGVGPIQAGDVLTLELEGVPQAGARFEVS
ncbi:MAG: fumarylacetoacetate hydrolase family protein [Planctomycetota bacterium]